MFQIHEISKVSRVYMYYHVIRFGVLPSFEEFLNNLKVLVVDTERLVTRDVFKLYSRKVLSGSNGVHFSGAKLEPGPKRSYNELRLAKIKLIYEIMRNGGSDGETCRVYYICLTVFYLLVIFIVYYLI